MFIVLDKSKGRNAHQDRIRRNEQNNEPLSRWMVDDKASLGLHMSNGLPTRRRLEG
jgi:hypothetical protein